MNLARTAATALPAQLVAAGILSRLRAEVSAKHALIISMVDSNAAEVQVSNKVCCCSAQAQADAGVSVPVNRRVRIMDVQ